MTKKKRLGWYEREREDARQRVMDHQCEPRISRSWTFRTPSKGNHYAFSLTWTPGVLALAGDCGELTLTHYHALREPLAAALDWAATSSMDYLFEKSNRRQSYDPEGTLEQIVRWANEPAIEHVKGLRERLAEWRAEKPDPADYRQHGLLGGVAFEAYKSAFKIWKQRKPKPDLGRHDERVGDGLFGTRYRTRYSDEGYARWALIAEKVGSYCVTIEDALTPGGRARIKRELESELENPEKAAEFQYGDLNFDSESINCYKWTFSDILQMTCIQLGAKLARQQVLAELEKDKAAAVVRAVVAIDAANATPEALAALKTLAEGALEFTEKVRA